MIYDIKYDPKAEEQLEKLPREISQRIVKKLAYVSETGRGIEPLRDEKYGYKIRVGDYRVLVDITYLTKPPIVWVRYMGHRRDIYKRIKK